MDDLHHPSKSKSESYVSHLGPSITVTKVVSSSEILESTKDEADVKIEEDDIKIKKENLHIEVVDDVNMEDTETEKICDLCPLVFKSVRSLQGHKKVKHDTRECICPVVGMQKLAHHRRLHETFKCPSCDKELEMNQRSLHIRFA